MSCFASRRLSHAAADGTTTRPSCYWNGTWTVDMVLDRLANWRRYAALHPGFESAFNWLLDQRLAGLAAGRHTVDGDRLYTIVGRDPGRGRDGARLEAHRRYIDIQLTLAGEEEIGWSPLAE